MSRRHVTIRLHEPVSDDPFAARVLDLLDIDPRSIEIGAELVLQQPVERGVWHASLRATHLIDPETTEELLDAVHNWTSISISREGNQ